MIIGPKYKIARRLGAPVFEKTQTQKYALNLEKKGKRAFGKMKTEFGMQMNEKQKARFTYAISEKQFSNYVREALAKKGGAPSQNLFEFLETRLDNVLCKAGFTPTRIGGKQLASHGHMAVNGRRVTTPSIRVKVGDKISINARSEGKPLFASMESRMKDLTVPSWIKMDAGKKVAEIVALPTYVKTDNMFDLNTVIEFYSR